MDRSRLFWLPLALALTFPALAQNRGGLSGSSRATANSELTISIVALDDRRLYEQVQVQVLNAGGAPVGTAFSDSLGQARFRGVGAGNYRVHVTGPGVEETMAEFQIAPGELNHMELVRVKRLSPAEVATTPGGNISVAALKIPAKARKEWQKGIQAAQQQEMVRAIEHFRKATELYPQYADAYNDLGAACMQVHDYACSREAFTRALSVDEHAARTYSNFARLKMDERDVAGAEALLRKAIAIQPLNPEVLTMLAITQLEQGEYDEALANARKVHSVPHKEYGMAHYVAARALEAKKMPAEAIAEYDLFLKEAPQNPNAERARQAVARLSPRQTAQ
jgi:Flp pilus assembly protein TadD